MHQAGRSRGAAFRGSGRGNVVVQGLQGRPDEIRGRPEPLPEGAHCLRRAGPGMDAEAQLESDQSMELSFPKIIKSFFTEKINDYDEYLPECVYQWYNCQFVQEI